MESCAHGEKITYTMVDYKLIMYSQKRSLGSDEYFSENIYSVFPYVQKSKLNSWNN